MTRTLHSGNAAPTTLAGGGISAGATSLTVATGGGATYPSPTGGQIAYLVLDAGNAGEEKVSYTGRSGDSFTGLTRGVDGTTAASHAAGVTVKHPFTAQEADDANAHVNSTLGQTGLHGLAGAIVGTTDTQTLTNKTFSGGTLTGTVAASGATLNAPTLAGGNFQTVFIDSASTIGGVSGSTLAADRTAWTSYTPTFTNVTSGAATAAYKIVGKQLFIRVYLTAGTITSTGQAYVSLPGGLTAVAAKQYLAGYCNNDVAPSIASGDTKIQIGTNNAGTSLVSTGANGVIEVQ